MEENVNRTAPQETEEEGIDIKEIVLNLWQGRKTIIICTAVFLVLGLISALTMKRSYTVQSVMVPQLGSSSKSGLGGLAALAGVDMGMGTSGGELSPLVYPQIVSSVPFRLKMIHTPLHYQKCDTLISMYDYAAAKYEKPSVVDVVMKYTIGLPGVIIGALRSKPEEIVLANDMPGSDSIARPLVVSQAENSMMNAIGGMINLTVDKKEGIITLTVNGREPIQTAELAMAAQAALQDEITRFRIEKSQSDLDYIQARYDEAKEEAERYQVMLASATDRAQYVTTSSAGVGRARLQSRYNTANAVYLDLAKQLEQAKMQVKKDTPAFSVIQPVTVPNQPSNSRVKKIIIWTFLGIVLGCSIVLVKGYWPKLMGMFRKPEEDQA